jgi:hypothetical protein
MNGVKGQLSQVQYTWYELAKDHARAPDEKRSVYRPNEC